MLAMVQRRYSYDSKLYAIYGFFLNLYRIFAITSFVMSVQVFLKKEMDQNISGCNEFSFTFPLLALAYDYTLKYTKGRQEKFAIFKFIIIGLYLGIMIYAVFLINKDPAYIEAKNRNFTPPDECKKDENLNDC